MQNKRKKKNRKRGEKGDGRVACPLVAEILGRTSEEGEGGGEGGHEIGESKLLLETKGWRLSLQKGMPRRFHFKRCSYTSHMSTFVSGMKLRFLELRRQRETPTFIRLCQRTKPAEALRVIRTMRKGSQQLQTYGSLQSCTKYRAKHTRRNHPLGRAKIAISAYKPCSA